MFAPGIRFFCLLLSLSLLFLQCAPLEVHQISLEPSQTLLPADGKNKTTLEVKALNAQQRVLDTWKKDIKIYLNGQEYPSTEFSTTTPGNYEFWATLGHLRTPSIKIQAKNANDYVRTLMAGIYLWADKIPAVPEDSLKTPEDIVNQFMFAPKRGGVDRWTHIQDQVAYENYYQGKYVGLGVRMNYDPKNQLRMSLVYEGSPAHQAGIRRGMMVRKINGKTIEDIEKEKLWDSIFGKEEEGVQVTFLLQTNDAEPKEYVVAKAEVNFSSVFTAQIVPQEHRRIGYLYFDRFISPSNDALNREFTKLKNETVEELVLDLRYNGGGLLHVANHLSNLLVGAQAKDQIVFRYAHNKNYEHWNTEAKFSALQQSLNLKRLFVITGGGTASASEVVINSIKPYIPVIIVGQKTYGKPVGAYSYSFFNKILSMISFRVVNSRGEGDYFDGFPPNIPADDDITHDLGDPQEACFKAALEAIAAKNLPLLPQMLPESSHTRPQPKQIPWTGIRRLLQAF